MRGPSAASRARPPFAGGLDPLEWLVCGSSRSSGISRSVFCCLAVASKGGADDDPVWAHNSPARPEVDLQDGPEQFNDTVRELPDGPERDERWRRAVETWPHTVLAQLAGAGADRGDDDDRVAGAEGGTRTTGCNNTMVQPGSPPAALMR